MSSESEIQKCKEIFLKKMLNKDSPKLPTELAAYIYLKTQKVIEEFFEREKYKELAIEQLDKELKLLLSSKRT